MIVNKPERRGRLFFFIWTGILFVGIAVMLYPKVGKIWNAGRQSRVVDGYERSVEKLDARKEEEMIAQTRAYNVMLLEQNNPVPNDKNADSYGALLNMTSDGVMGYLEIPEIRVKLPIYHGTGDFAICNGAGHVEGSSFPIGGKGTHAVLSSHRGLPGAKLFSDLDKLKVYDKYAMFLHGNNGLSRVEGDGEGKILVIKDSYANSFVPYLTANYAAIDVVDFRNYNYGLDQLIAANDYDQILVLYSYASFTTDPYLYRAGVAG